MEYLGSKFSYNDETGALVWKSTGKVAGHVNKTNHYIEIRLDKKLYKAHRLVYKLVLGIEPEGVIDHIDGNPSNNKIENLRLSTIQENSRNSGKARTVKKSQYKGVWKKNNGWEAGIVVDDKIVARKSFLNEIDAALWYDLKAKELFGDYAKVNFP